MSRPLNLTEQDVRARLDLNALTPAMERALAAFSSGEVDQPVRTVLDVSGRGFLASMPGHLTASPELLGAKLVTVFPGNAAIGLPTHLATIILADPRTGETLAVMDGRYITEVRTAAVSAVSVKWLARAGARTVGILGSGVQARSHVELFRRLRPWAGVLAWSPNRNNLRRFADECGVEAASDAEQVVRSADVVITATDSRTPVVRAEWVRPGTHVIAVGSCRPDYLELEPDLVAQSRLFVDSRAAALKESGDVLAGIRVGLYGESHILGELGQVIGGLVAGRQSDNDVTVFKSLGLAVEDLAAAGMVV